LSGWWLGGQIASGFSPPGKASVKQIEESGGKFHLSKNFIVGAQSFMAIEKTISIINTLAMNRPVLSMRFIKSVRSITIWLNS